MPDTIGGMPFQWLRFSKTGALEAMPTLPPGATDIMIVSHGWQTDYDGALKLYRPLADNIAEAWRVGAPAKPAGRSYAVLGVLWPSKAFDAHYEDPEQAETHTLSAAGVASSTDLLPADMHAAVEAYAAFTGANPATLIQLADAAVTGGLKQADCVALVTALLASLNAGHPDSELAADLAPVTPADAQRILQSLSLPKTYPVDPATGHAAGVGAVVRRLLRGPRAAVSSLLNKLTFFEMKKRAGIVGEGLASSVLPALAGAANVSRVHLVGHSFGARLVTAAAFRAPASTKWHSLTLLQGAFSHNAMAAARHGAFVDAYDKISGPTIITHTHRDKACTLAYAIASSLARDNATAIGDAHDQFGSMGANGAQFMPATALANPQPVLGAGPLALQTRKVHNLLADTAISGHMDVTNPTVAAVAAQALGA